LQGAVHIGRKLTFDRCFAGWTVLNLCILPMPMLAMILNEFAYACQLTGYFKIKYFSARLC